MRPRTGLEYCAEAKAAIGAELVGSGPEAFFQRVGGDVFFGGGDPLHAVTSVLGKRKENTSFSSFKTASEM